MLAKGNLFFGESGPVVSRGGCVVGKDGWICEVLAGAKPFSWEVWRVVLGGKDVFMKVI